MNTLSILEIGTKVWSKDKTRHLVAMLRQYARSAARFKTENSIRSGKSSSGTALSYRLGQIVLVCQRAVRRDACGLRPGTFWSTLTVFSRTDACSGCAALGQPVCCMG